MIYGIILFVGMEDLPYEHGIRILYQIGEVNTDSAHFGTTNCVLGNAKLQLLDIINDE